VSVPGAEIVSIDAVIVGQLEHRVLGLVAIPDERQSVLCSGRSVVRSTVMPSTPV
jgi:hypothetical protein